MRRVTGLVLLGVLMSVLVSACAPTSTPQATATSAPATAKPAAAATSAPAVTPTTAATAKPAAAAPTTAPVTPKPAPVAVKIGVTKSIVPAATFIAIDKGYLAEQGINADLTFITSANDIVSQLGTGQMEAGTGGWSVGMVASMQRGIAIKVVGDQVSRQAGFVNHRMSIRKDLYDSGQVKVPADFRGRKLGVTSPTNAGNLITPLLKEGGLTVKDVELVTLAYPDMLAAFANKAIDAAMLAEPLLTQAVEQGLVVRGRDLWDFNPPPAAGVLVFSPQFAGNVDAANRFMLGYVKALRDYNDAFLKNKGKKEIVDILAKYTDIKDLSLFDKMDMPGMNPDGHADSKAMEWDVNYWLSTGALKETIDITKAVDNRFVDNAIQKMGKFTR